MLLGVAVGQLTGALSGFALPALMGLQIKPIAITSTDPGSDGAASFLSIFANVSTATTPSRLRVDTTATLAEMQLPPTREFAVDARGATVPAAVLELGGSARDLEYSWSVDGGAWSAYTAATRVTVTDPQLWMQGRHTVDVRARELGAPDTTDPTPARVDIIVDTVAPTGGFDVAGHEIRVNADDAVSPADALQFRFAVAGGAFGPWVAATTSSCPPAARRRHAARRRCATRPATSATSASTAARPRRRRAAAAATRRPRHASGGAAGCSSSSSSPAPRLRAPPPLCGCAASPSPAAPPPSPSRCWRRAAARTASARATSTTRRTRSAATTTSSSTTARSSSAPTTTPSAISSTPRSPTRRRRRAGRSSTAST